MKRLTLGLTALLCGSGLSAQTATYTSPANHDNLDASIALTAFLDPATTSYSWMQIHDDMPLHPIVIRAIAFRPDATHAGSSAITINATIRLSTAATTSSTMSLNYANNHGINFMEVATNIAYNLPPTAPSTPSYVPQAFTLRLPFTRPYPCLGSPAGSLAWELRVHSRSGSTAPQLDAANVVGIYSTYGTGGTATGQPIPGFIPVALFTPDSVSPTTHFRFWLQGIMFGPVGQASPYVWLMGINNTNLGPISLPWSLKGIGGGANTLYVNPLFQFPGTTSTGGSVTSSSGGILVPRGVPALMGMKFYSQLVAQDLGNPTFPFNFTDACLTIYPYQCRVGTLYSAGSDTANQATHVVPEQGIITEFTY